MIFKSKKAFTMIELLMVIMIVSILGAVALPKFLDFRKEGKAAVVRQALATMRVGIKNQIQQARLKCGAEGDLSLNDAAKYAGFSFYHALNGAIYNNDITTEIIPGSQICTTAQIPNAEDRRFWNTLPDSQRTHYVYNGDINYAPKPDIPKNAFVVAEDYYDSYPMVMTNNNSITLYGGPCGVIANNPGGVGAEWYYNTDTGEIFAGTDTPGISECNF